MTIVHFHPVYLQICSYINVVIPYIGLVNTRIIIISFTKHNTTEGWWIEQAEFDTSSQLLGLGEK